MNVIDNNLNDKAFEQGFVRELLYPFYEWNIFVKYWQTKFVQMTTEKKKISIKFKHLKSAYSLDLYRYTHTYTRIYIYICIIKSRKREKEIYIFANLKKKTYKRMKSTTCLWLKSSINRSNIGPCILMIEIK